MQLQGCANRQGRPMDTPFGPRQTAQSVTRVAVDNGKKADTFEAMVLLYLQVNTGEEPLAYMFQPQVARFLAAELLVAADRAERNDLYR